MRLPNPWIKSIGLVLSLMPCLAFAAVEEEIRSLARMGEFDSAITLSEQALSKNAKDRTALFMLAKLSPEGKVSADYFHRLLKLEDNGDEVEESTFRLGQYYYAAGKYYRAIPFFREYLTKFSTGHWLLQTQYWMGNACLTYAQSLTEKSAYYDSAFIYFKQISSNQNSEEYYWALAQEGLAKVHMAQGNRPEAMSAVDSAIGKAPEEERAALLLLAAQIQQGLNRKEEKKLLNQLSSSYPNSPEMRYLRKLNSHPDPSTWKSGVGFPKPLFRNLDEPVQIQKTDSLEKGTSLKAKPKGDSASGFTLQIGAFSKLENAKSMVVHLSKLGFKPDLIENRRNGKPIFQVRLGRFASQSEALEYALINLKPHQLLSQPIPIKP